MRTEPVNADEPECANLSVSPICDEVACLVASCLWDLLLDHEKRRIFA